MRRVALLAGLQVVAFWPVIQWYAVRMTDGESRGLVALGTAVLCIFVKRGEHTEKPNLVIPTVLMLTYAATFHFVPPMARAGIAVVAMACLLGACFFGNVFQPGICALLILALPVIPSMQFYLGYPFRVIVGEASAFLLRLSGFAVNADGAVLNWCGRLIMIDAPCSGVRMLWTGLYVAFTLTAFYGMGMKKTAMAACCSVAVIIIGNVLRASALFHVESGMFHFPAWVHEGIGMAVFVPVAASIAWLVPKLREKSSCEYY